jgi:polysaccharide export outer membrane protein
MTKSNSLYLILLLFWGQLLQGQLDPRIASVLGNLSPQQKQMLASSVGMMNQRTNNKPEAGLKEDEDVLVTDEESDKSINDLDEEEKEEDTLQQLLFLEQLLLNDLSALEEEQKKEQEIEKLSANDQLRMIESLEQTKRLIFEVKQKQRDEIERQSIKLSDKKDTDLTPFGHDFFQERSNYELNEMSFVPTDYQVGPGDVLEVMLFGQKNEAFNLLINRDGIIQFPNIGPVNVFEQGREFINLKNAINRKIKEHLGEGVQSSITLGALRSISIFVLGQVDRPGAYLLPPHASITAALRAAGGVATKGSMRKIVLKRNGEVTSKLDLYDLLLEGSSEDDLPLEAGDVVFVPVVGPQITISGEVHVEAIYELSDQTKLEQMVDMAGGTTQHGFDKLISLKRRNQYGRFDLITLDLSTDGNFTLEGGDSLNVAKSEDRFVEVVEVFGPVERPGPYQWRKEMNLFDLFSEFGSFLKNADLRFGYIVRQNEARELSVLHFEPRQIIKGENTIPLQQDDRVYILSMESATERFKDIRRLILELKKHTPNASLALFVSISGEVHYPGEYPLSENMTARDLVLASGGLTDASFSLGAELTRLGLDEQKYATVEHIRVSSTSLKDFNGTKPFFLKPYDSLSIKPIPSWRAGESIEISGEVNFPGTYVIRPGEKLSEIIKRAGGLTERAFPDGAMFTRKSLAEKESEQRDRLIARLEADLADAALQALNAQEAARSETAADSMLKRLQNTESVGRLVINLSSILDNPQNQFTVKNGDKLHIPDQPSSVSVAGEVQFPTSHLHSQDLNLEDYLKRSGGFTSNADQDRIFVVKANGSVETKSGNKWFSSSKGSMTQIDSGDVIVVPIDVKQSRVLEQLSYTSQIIYQMAVAAAAVNSF